MKQTSIEWLEKQLILNGSGAVKTFPELFEQAKEMENEQRFENFKQGFHSAFESLEAANNSVQSKTFKSE